MFTVLISLLTDDEGTVTGTQTCSGLPSCPAPQSVAGQISSCTDSPVDF